MNTNAWIAILCVVSGMAAMGVIVWFAMPKLMMITRKSKLNFDDTLKAITEAVSGKENWKVLAVNDYKKSTEAFISLERVNSMNICNPRYASQILAEAANRFVTAFMPLAIGVYEDKNGQVIVTVLNVKLLGRMFGGTISKVMGSAAGDLRDIVTSVAAA